MAEPGPITELPCPTGDAVLREVLPPLARALDGTGPALVPVPDGPAASAVRAMARFDEPLEPADPDDPIALVVPTSGSTGAVKGALLGATALRHSAAATLERLGGPGRWLLALPTTHVAGLQVLVRSLLAGREPVVLDLAGGFDPAAFARATAQVDAPRRYTALVPTQLRRLLDAGGGPLTALASFDAVLLGGAATPPGLLAAARAAGVRAVTTYGMTETCGGCVYDGVPLSGVSVDLEPDGRIGLGGPTVFAGYRLRPDLTTDALLVRGGVRQHRTRDLGAFDPDGRLRVLGRIDDMIVSGGENVAPALVESVLGTHPLVREVAVVGVPDPAWGSRVAALVVPADPARPPGLDALRQHAAGTLPAAALPRSLVLADTIPLLPSGKPDRRAVRASVVARLAP